MSPSSGDVAGENFTRGAENQRILLNPAREIFEGPAENQEGKRKFPRKKVGRVPAFKTYWLFA